MRALISRDAIHIHLSWPNYREWTCGLAWPPRRRARDATSRRSLGSHAGLMGMSSSTPVAEVIASAPVVVFAAFVECLVNFSMGSVWIATVSIPRREVYLYP